MSRDGRQRQRRRRSAGSSAASSSSQPPYAQGWLWDWPRKQVPWPATDPEVVVGKVECWLYEEDSDSGSSIGDAEEGEEEVEREREDEVGEEGGNEAEEEEEGREEEGEEGEEGEQADQSPWSRSEIVKFYDPDTVPWLHRPPPTRDGKQPSHGLKLLVMPFDFESGIPPIDKESADLIDAAFGLPCTYGHFSTANIGACGTFAQPDGSYVFILRKTSSNSSMSTFLRYDPSTNISRGVCLYFPEQLPLASFAHNIPSQFSNCAHPLAWPLLTAELTLESITASLATAYWALREVESKTGYGLRIAKDDDRWTAPLSYQDSTKKLGQAQSSVALSLATIATARFAAEFVREWARQLEETLPEDRWRRLRGPTRVINERVDFFLSNIEHAEANFCVDLKERLESQQTVLFNLIAQSDSLLNVSLAKDSREIAMASKEDSSAMKIIALLTTFFLPGTFMATFFAMPLFNWSQPSINSVATRHLWIYWAVTGPLTLAIIVGVVVWVVWNKRRVQKAQLLARDSIGRGESPSSSSNTGADDSGNEKRGRGAAGDEWEEDGGGLPQHMRRRGRRRRFAPW